MDPKFFDAVKRRTLVALFSNPTLRNVLVLKGGNLLALGFQIGTRASVDLDFSIEGDFAETEEIRRECDVVLSEAFAPDGMRVFDVTLEERPPGLSDDIKEFWGGYQIRFKLAEDSVYQRLQGDLETLRRNATPLAIDGSTVFRIDISKFEFCGDTQSFPISGQQITGYSPELAIAEKLRAICQQMPEYNAIVHRNRVGGRARDFLDIYTLREAFLINFDNEAFRQLV
ncbi:MAG TPA: nucleotidyl transferase AbiEii/AbiGii toxin family protein [Pirellulales bacterium]|nr:nucleotidyl transferase AbiEii/AbiGii toxin family protein [Pirellulales bacterium]